MNERKSIMTDKVLRTNNHRIQKFTSAGTFLAQWGSFGDGNGQFNFPDGIAVDAAGHVYVADTGNYRIQVFGDAPTPATSATWGQVKDRYRK